MTSGRRACRSDRCSQERKHVRANLRALSAKKANHLQTTDTIKRHQRCSVHYTVADPPSGYGGQPHTMASRHYQSHSCVPVVCTGLVHGAKNQNNRAILACLWFAQGLYRAQKIKTTESFLRACGLHNMMFRVILCVSENNGYIREYKRNSCLEGRPVWSGGLSLDR